MISRFFFRDRSQGFLRIPHFRKRAIIAYLLETEGRLDCGHLLRRPRL
jgi:hypothetical protein